MSALGKCTACDEDALADAKGEPHIHPKLGVLLCERCYGRDTRVFELDDDGYEQQCRWCGVGGDLVGCDRCISSYCECCINRNLGKKHLGKVKKTEDWACYSCDPTPTISLRWDNKKSDTISKKKPRGRAAKQEAKAQSTEAEADQVPTAAVEVADSQQLVHTKSGTTTESQVSKSIEELTEPEEGSSCWIDPALVKKMKVAELREELSARGLSTKGKKDALIDRLVAAMTSEPVQTASASASQAATELIDDDTDATEQAQPDSDAQAAAELIDDDTDATEQAQPDSDTQAAAELIDDDTDATEQAQPDSDAQAATELIDDGTDATEQAQPDSDAQAAAELIDDDTDATEQAQPDSDAQAATAQDNPVVCITSEPADPVAAASPRRLHSTPRRPAPETQEQLSEDSPIELMSIGAQDAIAMDGRPSGLISPSQIGQAIEGHKFQSAAQPGVGRKRNLDALESELDAEVDSRCKMMVNNARAYGDALRTKFKSQLCLLRPGVRTMTLRDFAEAYGVGLEAQIMTDIRQRLAAEGWVEPQETANGTGMRTASTQKADATMPPPQSIPAAMSSASKENMPPPEGAVRRSTRSQSISREQAVPNTPMGLKTPAFDPRLPYTPATAARCPRRGESLMSANGSPLAIFGGARATFGLEDGDAAAPLIQVALRGGEAIDLSDNQSIAGLGRDAREEARGKLQGLQEQLQELLQSLA